MEAIHCTHCLLPHIYLLWAHTHILVTAFQILITAAVSQEEEDKDKWETQRDPSTELSGSSRGHGTRDICPQQHIEIMLSCKAWSSNLAGFYQDGCLN